MNKKKNKNKKNIALPETTYHYHERYKQTNNEIHPRVSATNYKL